MARTQPIKNKEGKIISYQIRVFRGKDSNGKELKPYSTTWKIPSTYKTESAIQRGLQKAVSEFEAECKRGNISVDKRTFSEYAEYFLEMKKRDCKNKSIDFYQRLLPRINEEFGCTRLSNLTPETLNKFYLKLESPNVRQDRKAIAKDCLLKMKKENNLTHAQVEHLSGLSSNTIRLAFQQKKISVESAQKISNVFSKKMPDMFEIIVGGNGKGLSSKYIRHYHNLIHDILELALSEGIVPRNVADMATPPKAEKHEAEFFEIEEILAIRDALQHAPRKYQMMLFLLIETGCRRGELVGIRWRSVNFDECTITIENNIQWTKELGLYEETPKNHEIRTLAVAPEIIKSLKQYKAEQQQEKLMRGIPDYNSEGYLFIQDNGTPMNPSSLNHWLKKFEKENNLPHIHPHKFRHSQASILYASGVDVVTISKRLGHKQVSTTQNIYAHLLKESDKKASDAIANALYRNQA